MNHKILLIAVALTLLFSFGSTVRPAQAQVTNLTDATFTCNFMRAGGNATAPFVGVWVYDYDTGQEFFRTSPVNADGTFVVSMDFPRVADGDLLIVEVFGVTQQSNSSADIGSIWDGQMWWYYFGLCNGGDFGGPSRPVDSILVTITCDTAVYDEPGGKVVGDNKITNGQTWYVGPKPLAAPDGSKWTAVFVGSYDLGYIPARCAGQDNEVITKVAPKVVSTGGSGGIVANFTPGQGTTP